MNTDTNDLGDKLAIITGALNLETTVRGNAIATLNGRLNALEKFAAEDLDDMRSDINSVMAHSNTANAVTSARLDALETRLNDLAATSATALTLITSLVTMLATGSEGDAE